MDETEFMKTLKDMIKQAKFSLEMFEIVTYDETNGNIVARRLFEKNQITDIIVCSVGLGNDRGIAVGYEPGDYFIGAKINGQVFLLNTIYNEYNPIPDVKIIPKSKEMIIKSNSGSKIKLSQDGSFKVYNSNNYGIECDSSGNITIFGSQINNLKINGTTASGGSPAHTHDVNLNVQIDDINLKGDF